MTDKQLTRELINSCQNKQIKYPDEAAAAKAAVRVEREKCHFGLEPYKCKFCDGWHIGHPVLYKSAAEFAYWCQDVVTCLLPVIQNAPSRKEASQAYKVGWGAIRWRAATIFLGLKKQQKTLQSDLQAASCRRIGLTQKAAHHRLHEIYVEKFGPKSKKPRKCRGFSSS